MNPDDQREVLDRGDGLADSRGVLAEKWGKFAVRLVRGDSVRVVALAVLVILVFSLFVEITGEGRGFYRPEVALSVVMTVLFGATLLTGKPLSYTVTREIRLEPAEPAARLRRHRRITFAWFVFWAVHVTVMVPHYLADKVVLLGTFALVFGKPALAAMLALTSLWVRDKSTARAVAI
ncbi:DUF3159 domain-containing protein [Nocardia sp. NBC_01499]|uniref:DUF3159 domain-containing protein n=1 Tax=Nocardia sp. NBC_01499 TaxID=2903597 RepID=UPI00386601EA